MTLSTRTRFLDRLQQGVLIGDGAMATLLYKFGVPARACFESLCLTEPDLVRHVHREYLNAGAELIQTNTFSGNRLGLARYGLEDGVESINRSAVRLAREATGANAFVFGTVGPSQEIQVNVRDGAGSLNLYDVFEEQITALLDESVDGLLLETFAEFSEAMIALEVVRRLTDLPVIVNLAPDTIGKTRDGEHIATAFSKLLEARADVVGLNCRLGLTGILRTYEQVPRVEGAFYSAVPNAGMLHLVDGDYSYTAGEDYFAEVGRALFEQGVTFLGGCCGTTPQHIAKLSSALKGSAHSSDRQLPAFPDDSARRDTSAMDLGHAPAKVTTGVVPPLLDGAGHHSEFSLIDAVQERLTVVVELDPPRSLHISKYLEGAKALKAVGADVITLADNSLGMVRVSNMALASILKTIGIEPLVHVTCRDRNLIGQQSHLMGLHILDIHHILLVTGDPTRFGDLPGAASVYDVSSTELTKMVKRLNNGVGFSGQELKTPSKFVIGTSFNPNVPNFNKAVERLKRKLDAGADYVLTQPIYDPNLFETIAKVVEPFRTPVFAGIMPITSVRNALFLHHEVPGIRLTDEILTRMKRAPEPSATEEGMAIATELLDHAIDHFNGIYLVTPFLRYDLTVSLTKHAKTRQLEANIS